MLTAGFIIVMIVGYLLGSIPTGYLVAHAKGVDIRTVGSGNIGATNVFRILGKAAGVFVLLVDAAKGFAAVWLAARVLASHFAPDWAEWFGVVAGIAAVLGHNYTLWLRFKGGKGIATSAGVLAGLVPMAVLICLAVWAVIFFLSRYVSLASISAAFILPFAVWYSGYSIGMIIVTGLMATLAIYKHKANIDRLLKGTENRIGKRPTPPGEHKT